MRNTIDNFAKSEDLKLSSKQENTSTVIENDYYRSIENKTSVKDQEQSEVDNVQNSPYRWVILIIYSFCILVTGAFGVWVNPVSSAMKNGFDASNQMINLPGVPSFILAFFYYFLNAYIARKLGIKTAMLIG